MTIARPRLAALALSGSRVPAPPMPRRAVPSVPSETGPLGLPALTPLDIFWQAAWPRPAGQAGASGTWRGLDVTGWIGRPPRGPRREQVARRVAVWALAPGLDPATHELAVGLLADVVDLDPAMAVTAARAASSEPEGRVPH